MLRCPCEIIKPFAFATTKTNLILRRNSTSKIPFGCSCTFKRGIFLHLGRCKHLTKKKWELQTFFIKEQKSFLWTSFLFWKDKGDKVYSGSIDGKNGVTKSGEGDTTYSSKKIYNASEKDNAKTHNKSEKKTINLDLITKTTENIEGSPLDKESQVPKVLTGTNISENVNRINIINSIESKESKEIGKANIKSSKDSSSLNSSKENDQALETMILSKSKDGSGSKDATPTIENQLYISPVIVNSDSPIKTEQVEAKAKSKDKTEQTTKKNEDKSQILKLEPENRKEGEIKRPTQSIDLGDINKEISLDKPLDALSSERLTNENKQKETTQKILIEKAKNILRKTTSTLKPDEDSRHAKSINLGAPKSELNINAVNRRRQTVDLNRCSTERNFITPVRAMTDFLLKPSDLEGLRKTKRRSPYENDPPITVYWRKDVEAKALDVWGSRENLLKEILKRDIERRRYQQNIFTVKRRLRDYRREQGRETEIKLEQNGLFGSSGKVVLTAIAINGTNFMFKLLAWLYTGSHSMFSETIHSLADTINQLILAYGIHKSVQRADSDHPYGYTNMRYVASLISGVGIFCVGSGLSFYHGFVGLTDPSDLPSFYWAYFILGGSIASEGATLLVAFNSIRVGAKKNEMSVSDYIWRGQDPSVNVVLLEDLAAVIGVGFAGCCMGLSSYYDSHIPDAIGSFLVGGLLAGVASFIIYTNVAALVGRSIPQERLDKINAELESDVMIRAIHDVKGIDIGNSLVRYKAEMDFDGGELTRSYLDKQDLNQMLEEVKKMQTIDELEEFMLKHGENIVDMMGGEIDRIELKLRKKHPEIRHCDLEIL